ncbi:MAG: DoxX family protein [Chitinophagales bacterium]|jgi:putative oxidoreductase|nr:DoxX family protein [Saprospirales bacterium]MBP6660102.1 DoxX family protein [Chitinophagales bacterium]
MEKGTKLLEIAARIIAIAVFGYSAYMKLSGNPVVIDMFQQVGLEPFGRYGIAIIEIIAIVLLAIPKTVWRGGILGCFMMFGALCFHLTLAKIDVGDGGKMFGSAVLVFLCCFAIIVFHEQDLEHLGE